MIEVEYTLAWSGKGGERQETRKVKLKEEGTLPDINILTSRYPRGQLGGPQGRTLWRR
jgi:hypothetical protein